MPIGLQRATPEPAITAAPPAVQRKARLGPVNDPLEREADRIADQVVAETPVDAISSRGLPGVQRKCTGCEAEEDSIVRRKAAGRAAGTGVDGVAAGISHSGVPLAHAERAYFEPRFGRDFSAVRIHADEQAATAAAGIGARAFTLGRDIAFARDEYRPATDTGRRLIAHELAHTLQQNGTSPPVIRRASYGSGTPPVWRNTPLAVVPQDERVQVDEAMGIIDEIVAGPGSFSACHDHFTKNCPGGTVGTLPQVWQRTSIWRNTNAAAPENGSAVPNGSDIAYTATGFGQGAEGLAGTFLHESGHNCGIPGGNTHWLAAQIRSYCIGPGRNSFSLTGGGYLGGEGGIAMLSYRRLLGDFAAGRLRFTLGADLNVLGTIGSISEASQDTPNSLRKPGEFGSAMVGGQVRMGGWGGSRYGGFGLRLETGLGAGQFSMRRATADEDPSTTTGAGWVLQVGPRAEFLIKSDDAHVRAVTLSAAYRVMQPLNNEARALHAFVGSVEFQF
jgi:Domain of unknown function (DUF4157)